MLSMQNVTKVYEMHRQQVVALDDATLEIPEGDFVSLIGPSGSGKSSLLVMLGGMLSPTSGQVLLNGQSMYDLDADG
ncbi:MAG: ATP-binding cassette domain-containing protein, partial [Rhodopirellula sp. JB055]